MPQLHSILLLFLYSHRSSCDLNLRKASARFFSTCIHGRQLLTELISETARSTRLLDQHLNPSPEEYGRTIFADKCTLMLQAGSGGHGCISFLREKFIAAGPSNGGDGGSGGNIYIQAVHGETSLHKLARRGILRAGRGRNGQGKNKGGQRGEDILLQVPVGTIVREISRYDPVTEAVDKGLLAAGSMEETEITDRAQNSKQYGEIGSGSWRKDKWVMYPSSTPSENAAMEFPLLPKPRKSSLAASQAPAPIALDLSKAMEQPRLLAAGAVGGLGNPHFVTQSIPRPKFATKGEIGMKLELELELKLLADVGFVGLPNAGKSTLLRALSNSRARVGDWAFTTLQPNIGTVVLDNNHGRPKLHAFGQNGERRTQFSIADIPGLIPGAHLDRGLGLGFLRHIERARVLAFVVDLNAKDVVGVLQGLWKELGEFEKLRDQEINSQSEHRIVEWQAFGSSVSSVSPNDGAIDRGQNVMMNAAGSPTLPALHLPPISSKPWFVVATKADLESTQENFDKLQTYLDHISKGAIHPSGKKNPWRGQLATLPVSAIRGEGVDQIAEWVVTLLRQ